MILCECEWKCGILIPEFDKQGRRKRFVNGHQCRGKTHSPETRQLMSDSHVGLQSGEKHPMFGKTHSPETKQLMSKNHAHISGKDHYLYGKHLSPETKQLLSIAKIGKYCGEKHPNWQGGISKEPYCQEWDIWLKEEIKERDNFKCQNPNCDLTTNLCVHHIDYDKKNCSTNNLITLCASCNSRANFNREYWKEYYSNIINY